MKMKLKALNENKCLLFENKIKIVFPSKFGRNSNSKRRRVINLNKTKTCILGQINCTKSVVLLHAKLYRVLTIHINEMANS